MDGWHMFSMSSSIMVPSCLYANETNINRINGINGINVFMHSISTFGWFRFCSPSSLHSMMSLIESHASDCDCEAYNNQTGRQ